ncbi:hypothetical protein BBJ28_00021855 [Nothophytophthora sp. Chile5]|nr:hypothetical protein BBJ28_00021855 [Nothophytophthora sp. Chile5]
MKRQHRPALWQFIRLVAKHKFRSLPERELQTNHAAYAWCLRCNKDIFCHSASNNVKCHMQKYHPGVIEKYEAAEEEQKQAAQRSLDQEFDACDEPDPKWKKVSIGTEKQAHSNLLLAKWIACSLRPISIVEDEGFRAYVNYVAGDLAGLELKVPSRTEVRGTIMTLAQELRSKLKERLVQDCCYYTLTTDIWTDRAQRSYIALTVHYVSEQFDPFSWTLEVQPFAGKHTGLAIAKAVETAMANWGLDPQRCTKVLRDGGSNGVVACNMLNVPHMSCFAHCLHLVVAGALIKKKKKPKESSLQPTTPRIPEDNSDGVARSVAIDTTTEEADDETESLGGDHEIETEAEREGVQRLQEAARMEVEEFLAATTNTTDPSTAYDALMQTRAIVQKFRKLASYFHRSPKGSERLNSIQRQLHFQQHQIGLEKANELKLIVDCPTRWNSCYKMLQRFIQIKPAVVRFFCYLETSGGGEEFSDVKLQRPTLQEWLTIRCLRTLLTPFASASEALMGQNYPTLSLALPCLRHIRQVLQNEHLFDSEAAQAGNEAFVRDTIQHMQRVRTAFLTLFDARFSALNSELFWVTLLDPRYTKTPHLTSDERSEALEMLVDAAYELAYTVTLSSSAFSTPEATPSDQLSTIGTPQDAMDSLWDSLYGPREPVDITISQSANVDSAAARAKVEIELYAYLSQASKIKRDNKIDAYKWWGANRDNYPTIAPLARKWLGCVATSVPSERAFSTGGNIVTVKRCSLKPEFVRDIVFVAENCKPPARKKPVA